MPPRKRNYTEKPVETGNEVKETETVSKETKEKPVNSKPKTIRKSVNVHVLNLRDKPDGSIKRVLKKGQVLTVTRFDNIWVKVDTIDGKPAAGYVMEKFLREIR